MSTNDPSPFGNQRDYPENPFASPMAVDHPSVVGSGELTLNPWASIWTKPRETIRQIVNSDPRHGFLLIGSLYGVAMALGQNGHVVNGLISVSVFVAIVVVLGPPVGLLMLAVFSWAMGLCCRLFSSEAPGTHTRAAVTWSCVPLVAMLPLSIGMAVYMITSVKDPLEVFSSPVIWATMPVSFGLWIWSVVICVQGLSEVHQFAWWKGLVAYLLSGALLMVIFFALIMGIAIAVGVIVGAANVGFQP